MIPLALSNALGSLSGPNTTGLGDSTATGPLPSANLAANPAAIGTQGPPPLIPNFPQPFSQGIVQMATNPASTDSSPSTMGDSPKGVTSRQNASPVPQGGNDIRQMIQDALSGGPASDPRVGQLYDASMALRNQVANLQTPQNPGVSVAQALIGVAGTLATADNPHAQFMAGYLPALGQAIQAQYGNSVQAWQVARENLLNQADRLAQQAGAIQDANLRAYIANVGFQGRGVTALAGYDKATDVQAMRADAQIKNIMAKGVGADDQAALRALGQGNLNPAQQKLYLDQLTRPGGPFQVDGVTPEAILNAANSPAGKFILAQTKAASNGPIDAGSTIQPVTLTPDFQAQPTLKGPIGRGAAIPSSTNANSTAITPAEPIRYVGSNDANAVIPALGTSRAALVSTVNALVRVGPNDVLRNPDRSPTLGPNGQPIRGITRAQGIQRLTNLGLTVN